MADGNRQDDAEDGKRFFRSSDRVFHQADGWYYSAREGDVGPFDTEDRARGELHRFIEEQKALKAMAEKKQLKEMLKEEQRPKARKDVWRGMPDVD